MRILIKNGHVIDTAAKVNSQQDLLVEDGRVAAVGLQDCHILWSATEYTGSKRCSRVQDRFKKAVLFVYGEG